MTAVRVGVVGAGWWATQYLMPAISEDARARLAAICDTDASRLARAAAAFEGMPAYPSLEAMLGREGLDALVVATPPATHYEVTRAGLSAGLHAFVEKPLTVTSSHAWELVELTKRQKRVLTVGYTHHYTRAARRLRELLHSGALGRLTCITGTYATIMQSYYDGKPDEYATLKGFAVHGPHPDTYRDPRLAGGGQGHAQLTHALGMLLWLTGDRPTAVAAMMDDPDLGVDLSDAVCLRLAGGAVVSLGSTGSLTAFDQPRRVIELYGSLGHARINLDAATLEVAYTNGQVESCQPLEGESPYPQHAPVQAFVSEITDSVPSRSPGWVGALTTECIEAAYRSAATGTHLLLET